MKRTKRVMLLAGALLILLTACSGGNTGGKPSAAEAGAPLVLRVCVEGPLRNSGETFWNETALTQLAQYYQTTSGHKIEFEKLPSETDERANRIQKLKTEMMAGKGPDIFVFSAEDQASAKLIPDFNKAMHTGIFAELSPLLEADENWEDADFYPAILQAGAVDGKQIALPLAFTYYSSLILTDQLAVMQETNLAGTAETYIGEMVGSQADLTKHAFIEFRNPMLLLDQPLNYQTEAVTVSEEDLVQALRLCAGYQVDTRAEDAQDEIFTDFENEEELNRNLYGLSADKAAWIAGISPGRLLLQAAMAEADGFSFREFPLPTLEGQYTALIQTGAAVSANCSHVQEAYDFIKLLLSEEVQSGRGFSSDEGRTYGARALEQSEGWPVRRNIPVRTLYQNQSLYSSAVPMETDDFLLSAEEITSAIFYSEIDAKAEALCTELAAQDRHPADREILAAADDWYAQLKIAAAE